MKVKLCSFPRKPAAAALILLLALVRLSALMVNSAANELTERLDGVSDGDSWLVRGRVVEPPRLRTHATLSLILAVDRVRFRPDPAWLPKWVTNGSGLLFFRVAELGANVLPCISVPRPSPLLICAWYATLAYVFAGPSARGLLFKTGSKHTLETAAACSNSSHRPLAMTQETQEVPP